MARLQPFAEVYATRSRAATSRTSSKSARAIVANRYPFVPSSPTRRAAGRFRPAVRVRRSVRHVLQERAGESGRHVSQSLGVEERCVRSCGGRIRVDAAGSSRRPAGFARCSSVPARRSPEVRFTLTPVELDAAATRFLLEVDGQTFDYRHGPPRSRAATWPGPNPGSAAATFEDHSGGHPNMVAQGPWAWFRSDRRRSAAARDRRHEDPLCVDSRERRAREQSDRLRPRASAIRSAKPRPAAVQLPVVGSDICALHWKWASTASCRVTAISSAAACRTRSSACGTAWLQECLAASRSSLGERWLDVYLTSPAWRFACAAGTCRRRAGHRLDGAERRSRGPLFPFDARRRTAARRHVLVAATTEFAAFFESAERLVIDTLAADNVDFERFDACVIALADELESVCRRPQASTRPCRGGRSWNERRRCALADSDRLAGRSSRRCFAQLLAQRLADAVRAAGACGGPEGPRSSNPVA